MEITIPSDDEPETLAERMLRAVLVQLLKSGKIDESDLFEAADALEGDGDGEAAYQLRILPVEAAATPQSEWVAEQRRSTMRIVPNGGNDSQ